MVLVLGQDENDQLLDPSLDLVVHSPDKHQWLENGPIEGGVGLEFGEDGGYLVWMLVMKKKGCLSLDGVDGCWDGQSCGLILEEAEV